MSPINGDFDQLLAVVSEDNTTNSQQEKQTEQKILARAAAKTNDRPALALTST